MSGRALRRRYGCSSDRESGPGKFQGEPLWVRHFHDVAGHGGANEEASYPEEGGWYGLFHVDAEDRQRFPELKKVNGVILYERSDGFVEGFSFTSKQKLEKAWADILEDTSSGEEDY